MMAPMHHPAMKHVGPTRAELGTRTIFNILGPLTNPAGVTRQLTGAFTRDLIRPMADTLLQLGTTSAWLVHGSDGTDELTITGTSWVAALIKDRLRSREFEMTPEDAGLPVHPSSSAIIGGTPCGETPTPCARLLNGAGMAHIAMRYSAAMQPPHLLVAATVNYPAPRRLKWQQKVLIVARLSKRSQLSQTSHKAKHERSRQNQSLQTRRRRRTQGRRAFGRG